jgi:hypothetical protein
MDEFGWGDTRLITGEGKDKKVIVNDDERFDDSTIPRFLSENSVVRQKSSFKFISSISFDCRI